MTKEIERYIDEYNTCQRHKNQSDALAGKLIPNAILEKPWSHISIDFITKLPLAQEYDSILVVCNHFTKMAYFIVTTEKILAEGLARIFWDHIWKLYGLPESIVSNRRLQFTAGIMKKLNELLGIQTKLLTTYYSQTNRQMERVN